MLGSKPEGIKELQQPRSKLKILQHLAATSSRFTQQWPRTPWSSWAQGITLTQHVPPATYKPRACMSASFPLNKWRLRPWGKGILQMTLPYSQLPDQETFKGNKKNSAFLHPTSQTSPISLRKWKKKKKKKGGGGSLGLSWIQRPPFRSCWPEDISSWLTL